MDMYIFDNLGLCHTEDGMPPGFCVPAESERQSISAASVPHEEGASELSMTEMLMMFMIANQLLSSVSEPSTTEAGA